MHRKTEGRYFKEKKREISEFKSISSKANKEHTKSTPLPVFCWLLTDQQFLSKDNLEGEKKSQ